MYIKVLYLYCRTQSVIPLDRRRTVVCLVNIIIYYAKVYFERNHTRATGKAQSNYYILLFHIIKYAIQH